MQLDKLPDINSDNKEEDVASASHQKIVRGYSWFAVPGRTHTSIAQYSKGIKAAAISPS